MLTNINNGIFKRIKRLIKISIGETIISNTDIIRPIVIQTTIIAAAIQPLDIAMARQNSTFRVIVSFVIFLYVLLPDHFLLHHFSMSKGK